MGILKTRFILLNYIVVLSIFNSASAQVDHWETIVFPSDTCHYVTDPIMVPSGWTKLDFDDTDWLNEEGGIGYGDNDDNTIISPVSSVYIRYSFNIFDVEAIDELFLDADYDDGFVAYLNGRLIARSNVESDIFTGLMQAASSHEASIYLDLLPERFIISDNQLQGLLNDGENVLAIEVHNFNGTQSSDLTSNFYLSGGVTTTEFQYRPLPSWFIEPITSFTSKLPIIKITSNLEIVDEPKRPANLEIIWNDNNELNDSDQVENHFTGPIAIEKRGQSSLSLFPKVGYGFETVDENGDDLDVSFLNFPEEEDWILHGPYSDKSLMRNVLAMHLGNEMGSYHSRTRYVELVINEEYLGIYVLMEKIKRDKNRVDINKLKEDEIEGDDLTGGYVIKIDKGEQDWYSDFQIMDRFEYTGFQYVSPNSSSIVEPQKEYIHSYIDSLERSLRYITYSYGGKRYDEYLDTESFVDHYILKELAKDIDAYRISSYYYKDKDSKGGKLKAGPAWDFNIAFGNVNYCLGNFTQGWLTDINCNEGVPFWWSRLLERQEFRDLLKCRWEELKTTSFSIDSINAFIDTKVEELGDAVDRNFQKWPVLNEYVWPNSQVRGSFINEVNYLKSFIANRHAWMDANLEGNCNTVSTQNPESILNRFSISPNPASTEIIIDFPSELSQVSMILYDTIGNPVDNITCTDNECLGNIGRLSPGMYVIHIMIDNKYIGHKKLIKL